MSTSLQPRQPKGTADGGQFTAASHTEPAVALAPAPARFFVLEPGDGEYLPELTDGQVIEELSLHRGEDGVYWIEAAQTVDFTDIINPASLGTDEAGRDAWLDRHERIIEDFLTERYGAELDEEGRSERRLEFTADLPEPSPTDSQIVDAAWNRTGIVALHNESDHGSFGSENLGRLLTEWVALCTSVQDRSRSLAEALRIDERTLDLIVEDRFGVREISDAAAMSIGRTFPADYPELRRLGSAGYADTQALPDELHAAWQDHQFQPRLANRINMMHMWILLKGDNFCISLQHWPETYRRIRRKGNP
jgi:hypothetical protein